MLLRHLRIQEVFLNFCHALQIVLGEQTALVKISSHTVIKITV